MYYRLNDIYALRKYTNDIPYIIVYAVIGYQHEVSEHEMEILKKCDGVTDFNINDLSEQDAEYLQKLINFQIIEVLEKPLPLKKYRAFKKYNHKRVVEANWALTVNCNLNCLHCLNLAGTLSKREPEITLDEAKIIIDKLVDYGVESVEIFGGEPTIYPHFMEVIKLIHEAGLEISAIDTNGLLVDEKMLDELKKIGVNPRMDISFDGLGVHDWMRNRKGCEEKAINAIKLCIDKGFKVNVAININKKTFPVLEKTIDYFIDMGVKHFKLLRTSETFRWIQTEKETGESFSIPISDFSDIMLNLVKRYLPDIRKKGVRMTLFNTFTITPYSTGESILSEIKDDPKKSSGWCAAAENGIFISYNGHVSPCPGVDSLIQSHRLYCDEINILKHSLEEILYSKFYINRYRITIEDVYKTSKECQECSRWNVCNGGVCRMNVIINPEVIAAGDPPEKEIFSRKDEVYCSLVKEKYIDAIAAVLDSDLKEHT